MSPDASALSASASGPCNKASARVPNVSSPWLDASTCVPQTTQRTVRHAICMSNEHGATMAPYVAVEVKGAKRRRLRALVGRGSYAHQRHAGPPGIAPYVGIPGRGECPGQDGTDLQARGRVERGHRPFDGARSRAGCLPSRIPRLGEELIATVAGFADRVEEHKAIFVEAGFGEDFVDTLRGAVKELEKTLAEKADFLGRRSVATSGLVLEFARAREMVRKLDSMVAPRLEGTDRLAGWKTLSRFARGKREEKEEQGENAGSTPAPSTPAVKSDSSTPEDHAA